MSELLPLLTSGLVAGAMYAMTASGLVLAYSASGIFNFSQGAVAFSVAIAYYQLHTGAGWPAWLAALVCAGVIAPLLGYAMNAAVLRRLSTAPVYARIVGTVGLFIALPSFVLFVIEQVNLHGGNLPTNTSVVTAPGVGPVPPSVWRPMENVAIDSDQLAVWVAAALAAVALYVMITRTRLGLQMRADVDRRALAEIRGVDTARVSGVAWMLTTSLGGLLGILLGPFVGLQPISYTFVVLGSIAAVVFAGLRSLPLAFAGGLGLGVIQNLVAGYSDDLLPEFLSSVPGLRSSVPFVLTVVLLFVAAARTTGRAARTAATEAPPPPIGPDLPPWRRRAPWVVFTAALVAYTQLFADDRWAAYVAKGTIIGIILLSFVIVTGIGGMISLAQATFVMAGAFSTGWLTQSQGVPFALAALAATAVAGVVGVIVAIPVRRLGALELALATLAVAFIGDLVVFQLEAVRNESAGYSVAPPQLGALDFGEPRSMAMLALTLFGLVVLALRNLQHSGTGRAMLATRSSEVGAAASGIATGRVKLLIFGFSAAVAGLGGALFAVVNSPIGPTAAPPLQGLIWLAAIVTWGVRRPGGALVGGLVSVAGAEILTVLIGESGSAGEVVGSPHFLPILFGLGAVGLAKDPDGIFSMVRRDTLARRSKRNRPEPAEPPARGAGPAGPSAPSVLSLTGVVAGYGGTEVLHGIDLHVNAGEVVALLGPNGAGKSTVVGAISGAVVLSGGTIGFDGRPIGSDPAFRRARNGLIVTPEQRGIFPTLSVDDNLSIALRSREARERVYARFAMLDARRNQAAGLLSGGEQQLLAMAPWLEVPPKVLVADEPTLGLSPMVSDLVLSTLTELRQRGVAIVLVEEKVGALQKVADRVVVIALGRVIADVAMAELDAATIELAYFGHGHGHGSESARA